METKITPAEILSPQTTATQLLLWLLLITLPATVQAQFNYTTENGQITIDGYTGPGGAVEIPSTINGLTVTSIGDGAFEGCTSLTSVMVPGSVTTLGGYAFKDCISLTSVAIPNSVKSIGVGAFYGCTSLISLTIPDSVVSLGFQAFAGCTNLTIVTIPNGITTIGRGMFRDCTSLTSITIPNSVTSINSSAGFSFEGAFQGCHSLTNVAIPDSVTSIGSGTFSNCTKLTNVTIPNSVTKIGYETFSGCSGLIGVHFQGSASDDYTGNMFDGADHVTVYYLPGTTGWGATFAERPTALWSLPYPVILSGGPDFGTGTNGFGFLISWATNAAVVVVEASPALATPTWTPVSTNTLTAGTSQFTDPQWTNSRARFYRLSPQ